MKKKIIIFLTVCLMISIGIVGYIIWDKRVVSTITLDINPSIEINLDKDEKVINVKALNDDAKKIVSNNYHNKSLEDVFELLISSLIDNGYGDENNIDVILYTDGKVKDEDVTRKIEFVFGKKDIHTEVIVIDNITKEDEELAKKYNVSPAKAAYIKSIKVDNEEIAIEDLAGKTVSELRETKTTGNYCDEGYSLEGSWCLKEIAKLDAISGEVCPNGYYEYNNKCYEEVGSIESDNYVCRDEFKLENNKCIRQMTENAIPTKYSCTSGTAKTMLEAGLTNANDGDANDIVCVDTSKATHPMSPCEVNDGTEYTISGGKCYWHKAPVIASGCPGKIQIGSFCWDDASNVLICVGARDGKQYNSRNEFCEGSVKYTSPIVNEYKCDNKNAKLNGKRCVIMEIEDAEKERICPDGYTLANQDRCINYNKTINKETGLICNQENARLKGNKCILYEMVEAKHN